MRYFLLLLLPLSCFADVECLNSSLQPNGTWNTTTKTCDGAVRPVYYRISRGTTNTDAQARTEIRDVAGDGDAQLGDVVMFKAGDVWKFEEQVVTIMMRRKAGTGALTITTTEHAKLPPEGTRITPAYESLMPKFLTTGNSAMFAFQVAPSPVSNVKMRGLYFGVDPAYDNGSPQNYGLVSIGQGSGYDFVNDRLSPNSRNQATVVVGSHSIGATVLNVKDATGFAPNMWLEVGGESTGEDVQIDSVAGNAITLKTPLTLAQANNNFVRFNGVDGTSARQPFNYNYAPTNITFAQCIFGIYYDKQIHRQVSISAGKNITFRDSWFAGTFQTAGGVETKIMLVTGVDGFLFENNWFNGSAISILFGGAWAATGLEGPKNGIVRYNFFNHDSEGTGAWSDWAAIRNGTETTQWLNQTTSYTLMPHTSPFQIPGVTPSSRLVFKGRPIWTPSGQPANLTASNARRTFWANTTGVVGLTEPDWSTAVNAGDEVYDYDPAVVAQLNPTNIQITCGGVSVPAGGVCWKLRTTTFTTTKAWQYFKNKYENKTGTNINTYGNVFDWFPQLSNWNTNQYMAIKVSVSPESHSGAPRTPACADDFTLPAMEYVWPECFRPRVRQFNMRNNILRRVSGSIMAYQGYNLWADVADFTIENNLSIQDGYTTNGLYPSLLLSGGKDNYDPLNEGYGRDAVPINSMKIRRNTFYTTGVPSSRIMSLQVAASPAPGANLAAIGGSEFTGNLFVRGANGSVAFQGTTVDGEGSSGWLTNQFPNTATGSGILGKNIVLGSGKGATMWDRFKTWTGCGSHETDAPACLNSVDQTTDLQLLWSQTLRLPGSSFSLKRDHPFAHDGVGADPMQLPQIRNLRATPGATRIRWDWAVTPLIAGVACTIELHTSPDFENDFMGRTAAYVGELSQLSAYYGREIASTVRGLRRTVTLGSDVALTASTTYYYRLHCGGDVQRGAVTTLATDPTPPFDLFSEPDFDAVTGPFENHTGASND